MKMCVTSEWLKEKIEADGECGVEAGAPRVSSLIAAVKGIDDDYMTSENHHPGYMLIPTAKFEEIRAALSAALQPPKVQDTAPVEHVMAEYVVWSNEHKCWWGPNNAGYYSSLAAAGRYTREAALKICVGARGGRQFNSNPSEVPIPLADAEAFWPDDKEEWRIARHKHDNAPLWEDEE